MMDINDLHTRLPVVKQELYEGLVASKISLNDLYQKLALSNPMVFLFISRMADKAGPESAAACLMLYHILETQAECNELNDES